MLIIFIIIIIWILFIQIPCPCYAKGNTENITILATADVHGHILPWDYSKNEMDLQGSLVQIATLIQEIRNTEQHVIVLDAGDILQGNSSGIFMKDTNEEKPPAVEVMNAIGYDAWTVGNHEFDYGIARLYQACREFQGIVLGGNIVDRENLNFFAPYTILKKGPLKIGIIGMTTPMVAEFKEGTSILKGITITDPVEETKKSIREIKDEVDLLAGLFHMGVENENGVPHTGVRDIILENPELDVVIAAHMHELRAGELIERTLVAEPGKYGTHLLRMDLEFQNIYDTWFLKQKSSQLIPMQGDRSIEPDKEISAQLDFYHMRAKEESERVLGRLEGRNLVPKNKIRGIPTVQVQETALTDWISRVLLRYSGAMVVSHHIDNDEASLEAGIIRKKDILRNYQYSGGEITVYEITGKDLKTYMEWSAGYFNRMTPGDVTISFWKERRMLKYSTNDFFGGVCYTIDLRKPIGERIVNLTLEDGTPITSYSTLTLGLNTYRMRFLQSVGGPFEGKSFKMLYSTEDKDHFGGTQGRIQSLLMRDISDRGGILRVKLEKRWKLVGLERTLPGKKEAIALINEGILELPSFENATNIKSINLYEILTKKECEKLLMRSNVSNRKVPEDLLAGEFYQWLYHYRKKEVDF